MKSYDFSKSCRFFSLERYREDQNASLILPLKKITVVVVLVGRYRSYSRSRTGSFCAAHHRVSERHEYAAGRKHRHESHQMPIVGYLFEVLLVID